ncbi:MAG: hypothetical protein HUJ31_15525 [Pseudomonadales bacterium]|nr:hypothetical protein [Pseudomonadales bacterium]
MRIALEGDDGAYDWSSFTITCFVDAALNDVFDLWSTSEGVRRFWADDVKCIKPDATRRADDETFEIGDRVGLRFPTDTETSLEILNIEQDRFILFSFGEDYGWVRVMVDRAGDRTRIELRQFGLPVEADSAWHVHANARGWWIANLLNIKSVLGHGNDLRVRQPAVASGLATRFAPNGKAAASHDWSSFDTFLYYQAKPEDVIRYWQTTSGLEQFFIAGAFTESTDGSSRDPNDVMQGNDQYAWRFIHPFELTGIIQEVTSDSTAFTFGAGYEVRVAVKASGDGTLLHLHQSGMQDTPDERVAGSLNCRSCWIYFLVNLKSVIEHGVDLRDMNPETADSVSVGYNR